jgi:hypothetical protein
MSNKVTVTISATISNTIEAHGRSIIRIDFPAMTGTALTMIGGDVTTTATMKGVGDETGALSIASPSGRSIALAPFRTYGYECLRLVSGSSEATPRLINVYLADYIG